MEPCRYVVETTTRQLDLELCVTCGQVFRWRRLDDGAIFGVDGANWYRIVGAPTRIVRDALRPEAGVVRDDPVRLEVESSAPVESFSRLFRLDWDNEILEAEVLRSAPEMAPYLRALSGLRLLRPSDPVEIFYSFLCTPNNNLARITKMVGHLASCGESIECPYGPVQRFPRSAVIAAIPEQQLREAGFGYRARTIPEVAKQVMDRGGDDWIAGLAGIGYTRAFEELVGLKGIGPKLADCICLFSLGYTEAAPIDTHLWQALTRVYFPEWQGKPLTDHAYRVAGDFLREKFGPLAGWAHQHLFYDNLLNWRTRR